MLECPLCGIKGSVAKSKNSPFSPSQRIFRRVTINTSAAKQNCCSTCCRGYFIKPTEPMPEPMSEQMPEQMPTAADGAEPMPDPIPTKPMPEQMPTAAYGAEPMPERMPTEPMPERMPTAAYRADVKFAPKVNEIDFRNALRICRDELNVGFWKKLHDGLCVYQFDDRCRGLNQRIRNMWPDIVSAPGIRKLLSHFGAIRAHEGITGWEIYDNSRQAYFDPSNRIYAHVFGKVWTHPAGLTNEHTLGDLVECFLGLCYFMQHPDNVCTGRCHLQLYIYDKVDTVIRYVYDNWNDRDNINWS